MKDKELILAIDANAIVHRAFHAYPTSLTTSTGVQDNAVYGFTAMLLQSLKQFKPKYVVCAFDTPSKTFRHAMFSEYKGHRKPVDESLNAQFPLVKEVLKAFNIPHIEKDGFEADDILGTISEWVSEGKWSSKDINMCIITGDRDLLQLVNEDVHVALPTGSFSTLSVCDREKVVERYGYYPEQVTDYKAIVGDSSDNIPGVKGVGEKTVLGLLHKYGTLDNIYKNINEIEGRYRTKLAEGVEQAYFSKELATIKKDVDISFELEDCTLSDYDEAELLEVFRKFEFRSLISKLPKSSNFTPDSTPQLDMFNSASAEVVVVKEVEVVESVAEQFSNSIRAVVHIVDDNYAVCSYVDNSGQISICKISVDNLLISMGGNLGGCETYLWGWEEMVSRIDGGLIDLFVNRRVVDLQLLSYTMSSGRKDYTLETILFDYLSFKSEPTDYYRIGEALVNLVPVIMEKLIGYELSDYVVSGFEKASKSMGKKIEGIVDVVREIEMPVSIILSKMEKRGVAVDPNVLRVLKGRLEGEIKEVSESIYADIGHEVNLNSPKQLAGVIYNELNIPDSLGKRRSRSTREEVLLQMKDAHPAIPKILKYRELSKVLGTYVVPYLEMMSITGVDEIHTDFKQMGSSSGRFASINPNMQNIPVRGEWGDEIRKAFIPRDGFILVGADYSQIEFRVMADVSQDAVVMKDFSEGVDIHTSTASRILKKDALEITKDERSLGKTINFAILFGQTQFGLASMMDIDRNVAQGYIDEYFDTYKGVEEYISKASEDAARLGYVQSMLGRTRHVNGLTSRNFNVRSAALREAINMPIQGGEADIMKVAMIKIDELINSKYGSDVFMLLQVHDEFIFEVREGGIDDFSEDVREIMVNAVQLSVPLEVHISSGFNMSELK